MTTIELPPLPHDYDDGKWRYHADEMQAYARLAIEQDRARPVPGEDDLMALADSIESGYDWYGNHIEPQAARDALRAALRQALRQPAVSVPQWREMYSKVIKALAAIVNVHQPDQLFDLDAIPRDPVMAQVQNIRAALDATAPTPEVK